jgi:hypothetical protein
VIWAAFPEIGTEALHVRWERDMLRGHEDTLVDWVCSCVVLLHIDLGHEHMLDDIMGRLRWTLETGLQIAEPTSKRCWAQSPQLATQAVNV